MVSFTGNIPANTYSGTAIYCNNIDVSKLSKEERKEYLDKLSSVTCTGPGCSYPAGYYMNNYANNVNNNNNNAYKKKRVTALTDSLMQSLDQSIESNNPTARTECANMVVKLFDEEPARHNDKGLNVIVNKMLLDPYDIGVRDKALTLLRTDMASGDENTRAVLEAIKNNPQKYNLIDRHSSDIDVALMHLAATKEVANEPV